MSFKGKKHTQKSKNKIRDAILGTHYVMSEKGRKNVSKAHIGLQAGEKHGMFGKHHTIESKLKDSKSNRGKHRSPATEFKKGCRPWNWNGGRSKIPSEKQKKVYFDYIYNSWFKGSALHHMRYTYPVIGIYIPLELHQRYTHDIKMANKKALEWYLGGEAQ